MRKYRLLGKKGEGTFSEVLKAQSVKTGKCVAIKCMKTHFNSIEQVNNLREIQALRRLSPHPNIIQLEEVLYDKPTGRLALVFELMEMNLYELIRGRRHYLDPSLVRIYMFQLLRSVSHMHERGVFHRDLKPENILIESTYDIYTGLKLADFGSCRGMYSKQPYTEYISTRWYRAPECLLTDGYYGPEMDCWGIGCVMFEISALVPLFPGNDEKDQVRRIHAVVGTPVGSTLEYMRSRASAHMDFNFDPVVGTGFRHFLPHMPEEALDLLDKLLQYDPRLRIRAQDAVQHPYFKPLLNSPQRPPKIPSQHTARSVSTDTNRRVSTDDYSSDSDHEDHSGIRVTMSSLQLEGADTTTTTTKSSTKSSLPEVRKQDNKVDTSELYDMGEFEDAPADEDMPRKPKNKKKSHKKHGDSSTGLTSLPPSIPALTSHVDSARTQGHHSTNGSTNSTNWLPSIDGGKGKDGSSNGQDALPPIGIGGVGAVRTGGQMVARPPPQNAPPGAGSGPPGGHMRRNPQLQMRRNPSQAGSTTTLAAALQAQKHRSKYPEIKSKYASYFSAAGPPMP